LRAIQAAVVARPTHAQLARIVAGRLDRYPAEGGIPSIDPLTLDVTHDEANHVPAGSPIPPHLVEKAAQALEAPIDELVDRGIITSGEVLARVLPQITAALFAAGIDDPDLSALYGQSYAAFRRRRSLLLDLQPRISTLAPDLADRAFSWIVRRQAQRIDNWRAELQMVKNTAYAWRQAIFFLSFCDEAIQRSTLASLRDSVAGAGMRTRFGPAVDGLTPVIDGGQFDAAGFVDGSERRFLGWSVGRHWMLPATDPARR
jgi:hypothetical protein